MLALIPEELFVIFLVFTRTGAALMVMPGFGEAYVPPRVRLLMALAISVVVTPVVTVQMPALPAMPLELFILLFGEIVIGVFLGLIGRILLLALHTTGTVISFQVGMANAFVFDAATRQQASLPSMFLTVLGVLIIFTANLHHVMLRAVVNSYDLFTPGVMPPIEDFSQFVSRLVADSFILGIQLAGPFMAVGLIFYLGIGLLARLMPQVQIFFIALPMQIMFGLLVVALTLSAALMWFLDSFETSLIGVISPV